MRTINEVLADPQAVSDADLKGMGYGIKYYDGELTAAEKVALTELRQRLEQLQAAEKAARRARRQSSAMVKCDCGHSAADSQVMSTSSGTSCPDCYDRMSS